MMYPFADYVHLDEEVPPIADSDDVEDPHKTNWVNEKYKLGNNRHNKQVFRVPGFSWESARDYWVEVVKIFQILWTL